MCMRPCGPVRQTHARFNPYTEISAIEMVPLKDARDKYSNEQVLTAAREIINEKGTWEPSDVRDRYVITELYKRDKYLARIGLTKSVRNTIKKMSEPTLYAAKIELGWVNKWFSGFNAIEIIKKVEHYQDFDCLVNMGRANEDAEGQKELDKLVVFLNKYYNRTLTIDDLRALKVKLSIGDIVCHEVKEGDAAKDLME